MIAWFTAWWRRIAAVSLLAAWAASLAWAWSTSAELASARVLRAWDRERNEAESQRTRDLARAYRAADSAQVAYQQEREKNAAIARKQAAAVNLVARPDHECLSALVVQRLRDSADAGVPADSGGAAAGPGPAAGDPGDAAASERDVADWINRAREQYAGCRGQVRAIGVFDRAARGSAAP